ncbi:uncharacterized protein LOC122018732 [Zingiber officinale]|nr:uncharacterized protein LOC122018732 [Zingiber officinale]
MLRTPVSWWERFGSKTPELTTFAIRVLGLTCSASGCERNWSTFESIHTKKRNRLEHAKLNALVFVKYNFKLRERSIRRRDKIDPIVVDEINSDDEWITEKEGPVLPVTTKWLEDDELFESDPIVSVSSATFESLFDSDKRVEDVEDIVEVPPTNSKKRVAENSSGSKDKQARLSLVDVEDNHLDAENYGVIPTFDSGNFPTIDTIDDDSDIELDDTDYF